MSENNKKNSTMSRRSMLKLGAATGAATLLGEKALAQTCVGQTPVEITEVEFTGCSYGGEAFPTSPLILRPFEDGLPVPSALDPGWRNPDLTVAAPDSPDAWFTRVNKTGVPGISRPGPGPGDQDAFGERPVNNSPGGHAPGPFALPPAGTHQQWVKGTGAGGVTLDLPDPILYHLRLQVGGHRVTNSPVQPIDAGGNPVALPPGAQAAPGPMPGTYYLPETTIYGFNGGFPGAMVNAEYGRPVIIRFENDLDMNPDCRDRLDYGAPDWAFLTHQHNGHTAAESDGNPNHMMEHEGGYQPGEWSDNLYLNYPAGGDDTEKQSFLWFHDHRMHHTGPNVYKGMVGLMPYYDPVLDPGDETDPGTQGTALRLPGRKIRKPSGAFDVKYDIPLALYDCVMDDGLVEHRDQHTPLADCGRSHPEWWGTRFLKHYVNHGFVGDVFTVNGVAFPQYVVERRKYRFRFLGASLARCYDMSFRAGTPVAFPGQQGQYNLGFVDNKGVKSRNRGTPMLTMMQIANEGGLLPVPVLRQSIEVWPAKRREVVVDFSKWSNGKQTQAGEVVYLCNTLFMPDGRKPADNQEPNKISNYCVPMLKFIIGDGAPEYADLSATLQQGKTPLRPAPWYDPNQLPSRRFVLGRSGLGGETEWHINGLEFDPKAALAFPLIGSRETWQVDNGGGGWTHPMHLHQEEHHVLWRSYPMRPEDASKEDVIDLKPGEQTIIQRQFRTFLGNYVAHCHNLAHEDHNMMFGWVIVPNQA